MTELNAVVRQILDGDLSDRAQGFLVVLPRGHRGEGTIEKALLRSYGSVHHPDIRRLSPSGAGDMIKVDDMRDAQGFLSSTPSCAAMKTLVIYRAHRMNENAANALLKPLEEPTRHTRIILVTDDPAALPATVRSRCSLNVIKASDDFACREIAEQSAGLEMPVDGSGLDGLLYLANGNPHLAVEIHRLSLTGWLSALESWLGQADGAPPLPVLSGKAAVPLATAAMCVQSLLLRVARAETFLKGWNPERALRAAWAAVEMTSDIGRSGIDAKLRMHLLLTVARAA